MPGRWLLLLWAALLAIGSAQARSEPAPRLPDQADIRLVVDISGSMTRTDPDNLRRPALSLLVRLLPAGSQAGVWSFGQRVNALIPHQPVTPDWKTNALDRVDDINSVALFTHIGAALEAAAYDRDERTADSPRADIILLTDGMVDVSPDAAVNAREQARVVDELVPALRALGYRVHTIGLSDETDEALLRAIARHSDGMFSRARDADGLMDSLLQIFQQTVPTEQLPLNGGLFLIDESVREFTALIRREPGQEATALTSPNGEVLTVDTESDSVHWHHAERYDLITVRQPAPGRWGVNVALQPLSRVTVISNLQLTVAPLSNNIRVGEEVPLRFHIRGQQGVLKDSEWLDLLTLSAEMRGPNEREQAQERWQQAPPSDGVYRLTMPAPRQSGEYELQLTLDGKTFQRLFTHRFSVNSQFAVTLEKHVEEGRTVWTTTVDGENTVNPEQTHVVAHVHRTGAFGVVEPLNMVSPGVWSYPIEPRIRGHYRVGLQASGQTLDGHAFDETLPSQYFTYPEASDPTAVDPVKTSIDALTVELEQSESAARKAKLGETSAAVNSITLDAPVPNLISASQGASEASQPRRAGAHPAVLWGSLALANGLLLALGYWLYRQLVNERKPALWDDEEGNEETALATEPALSSTPQPMQQIDAGMSKTDPSSNPDKAQDPTSKPDATPSSAGDPSSSLEREEEPLFPIDDEALFSDEDEDDPRFR